VSKPERTGFFLLLLASRWFSRQNHKYTDKSSQCVYTPKTSITLATMRQGSQRVGFPWYSNLENFLNNHVEDFVEYVRNLPETNSADERSEFSSSVPPRDQWVRADQVPAGWQRTSPSQGQPTQQGDQTRSTPPASVRAIRQLPNIRVAPEDLVDPNNRECCICLEKICLSDKVTRLPCAHIFHQECIVDWLTCHHCTCPVCRYELQTDDPAYEAGRLERMKTRKPRFAMYELKRMSSAQLLRLNKGHFHDAMRKDLFINYLIREGRIELVPAPEPVEHDLDALRRMKISELKRTMEDAGVFFHAKDVVEKSDMVTIFLNSGRLSLRMPKSTSTHVGNDDSCEASLPCNTPDCKKSATTKRPFVETVEDDSDIELELKRAGNYSPSTPIKMFSSRVLDGRESSTDRSDSSRMDADRTEVEMSRDAASIQSSNTTEAVGSLDDTQSILAAATIAYNEAIAGANTSPPVAVPIGLALCPFQGYSISHLQDLARINHVDISSCFERSEIVRSLTNARVEMKHPSELLRETLSNFSISELRVIASEVNIDLSQDGDKEDVLHCMVQEATMERPYIQKYLRALAPLSNLNLGQLRKTARDWGVNINDCLERGEIIQRLITKGRNKGRS